MYKRASNVVDRSFPSQAHPGAFESESPFGAKMCELTESKNHDAWDGNDQKPGVLVFDPDPAVSRLYTCILQLP
jgi:hypothetical protein